MHGLIVRFKSNPGRREELLSILLENAESLPGCRSYVVARDPQDPEGIWVTEVWDSAQAHKASLELPAVQQAIGRARPLIAGVGERFETEPVGGRGA